MIYKNGSCTVCFNADNSMIKKCSTCEFFYPFFMSKCPECNCTNEDFIPYEEVNIDGDSSEKK